MADLVAGLVSDPSTRTCAVMQGWDYPFGRDLMLLADLFDLTQVIAADPKKRSRLETHPMRPWRTKKSEKFGNVAGRTRGEIEAILAAAAAGTLEAA